MKYRNKQNGSKSTNHNMLNAQGSPTYLNVKIIDEQKEVTNTGTIDI